MLHVPVLNPHEELHKELIANPSLRESHDIMVAGNKFPAMYTDHPVAVASDHKALPIVAYLDGVPTVRKDGVLGIWVQFLMSPKRHLCYVMRKSRMCQCGCHGWCTMFTVFAWLLWSLMALATDTFPIAGVFGAPFISDAIRMAAAGSSLGFICALVGIKGDWAEFCSAFGFATWASKKAPCVMCLCNKEQLYEIDGWDISESPFEDMSMDTYEAACNRCEQHVVVTQANHKAIGLALAQSRKKGIGGRVISRDLPSVGPPGGLLVGDRLEPSMGLPDIDGFEEINEYPFEVTFWRPSGDAQVKHRCPLFDRELGVTPFSLLVDLLHSFYLGVLKAFTTELIWELLLSDVWVDRKGRQAEEFLDMCAGMVHADLQTWMWYRNISHPAERLTAIEWMTAGMFGSQNKRKLALKAAESKTFFYFCNDTLKANRRLVTGASVWETATNSLVRFIEVLRDEPFVISQLAYQDTMDALYSQ